MNLKVNDRERWIIKLVRLAGKINKGYKTGKHKSTASVLTNPYNYPATEQGFEVRLFDHGKDDCVMMHECNNEDDLKASYEELAEQAWKGGLL